MVAAFNWLLVWAVIAPDKKWTIETQDRADEKNSQTVA